MARPKSKEPIKTAYVIFRVTPSEAEAIRLTAQRDGRQVSDLARRAIFAEVDADKRQERQAA